MILPRRLAHFNRLVTNRVLGAFALSLPGFGVIIHRGRRSGRTYRTPVNIFRLAHGDANDYVVALTYGSGADWVKNVLAAGGCAVITRGRTVPMTRPRLVRDERRSVLPAPVGRFLGLVGVTEFLVLSVDAG